MDTLCGVGLPELVLLALLGFVLIGPDRSKEVGVTVGRWLRTAMTSSWWQDFNTVTRSLRDLPNTLVKLAELEETQAELQRTVNEIDQVARIAKTPIDPPAPPPDEAAEEITDPWKIANAVSGTTINLSERHTALKEAPSEQQSTESTPVTDNKDVEGGDSPDA